MSRTQSIRCDLCSSAVEIPLTSGVTGWATFNINLTPEPSCLPGVWQQQRPNERMQAHGFGGLRGQDLLNVLTAHERFRNCELCPRCIGAVLLMLSKMGTQSTIGDET